MWTAPKVRPAPKVRVATPAEGTPALPPLDSTIWKPVPVAEEEVGQALLVDGGGQDLRKVAEEVWAGRTARFTHKWTDLLEVRKALNAVATARLSSAGDTADSHRERRRLLRDCARRLFVEATVATGQLQAVGGPPLGYLPLLYAGRSKLVFRANDITALNVAWQFFLNGLDYSFLAKKLHPFFGVYFTLSPVESELPWSLFVPYAAVVC